MRLSFSTLVLLEQAGDEAATVITRAHKLESGLTWEDSNLHISWHAGDIHHPRYYKMQMGKRSVISPARWSYAWECRSRTPLPIEHSRYVPSYNPNTLDYDYSFLYDDHSEM